MTFPARWPGRCVECGARFDEGDRIAIDEAGTICAECDAIDVPIRHVEPTPCPTCWLIHPEGACDRA